MAKKSDPVPRKAPARKKVVYNQSANPSPISSKWWLEPREAMHRHVFGVVDKIRAAQAFRESKNLLFARLYQNTEIMGLTGGSFARANESQSFLENRVSFNVIRSCIDTAASKLAKNRPRPLFLTQQGNWNLKRRAQKLTQYMEGLFDQMGTGSGDARSLYGIGRRVFVDGGTFGSGICKFFRDDENVTVKAERIFPDELIVDDIEGIYEQPMQMHQEKIVFRDALVGLYPDYEKEIMAANSGVSAGIATTTAADMIRVIESWHLPSGPNAEDGIRCVSIENATLACDPWKKNYFPFAIFRWAPRLMGFFGSGIAEELVGIQLEINKILRNIQIAQHLVAVPQVWLEYQSKALAKHINNQIGGVKYYAGSKPEFYTPQAMGPEIYNHLESLIRKAFELIGISQLSAAAKKPAGLDAKVALREFQDIESERFMLTGMRYEDFFMDATWIALDLLDDLAADGKDPSVWIKQGGWDRKLTWKDVKIPRDQYVLRPFPTALLPSRPEGKLAFVQELTQGGYLDREESLELLDYPDIQDTISVKLAPRTDAKRLLERMIDAKPGAVDAYETPEPFMNVTYAAQLAQSYYLRGRADGMPEEKLELLRRFMDDCKGMLDQAAAAKAQMEAAAAQQAQQQAQAQQAGLSPQSAGMAPTAAPAAPSVNELIPNAPGAA